MRLFFCRDADNNLPHEWEALEANDPEHAARIFADSRELGWHSWQEMTVLVKESTSAEERKFEVSVDWTPCYSAKEVAQP